MTGQQASGPLPGEPEEEPVLSQNGVHYAKVTRVVFAVGNQSAQQGGSVIPGGGEPEHDQDKQAGAEGDGVAAVEPGS